MSQPSDAADRPDATAFLAGLVAESKAHFAERATLLGFAEYLDLVATEPGIHLRDAAMYARDALDFYGTDEVERPYGRFVRYRLFDCPFDDGRDPVVGHEPAQHAVAGLLTDFVRNGRANRLVLLNGPNGSAKSSFVSCLVRGLEDYSRQPEGKLYTFNWVFPASKLDRGSIGFGSARGVDGLKTFAHLKEGDVDARIRCEMRDHPLLLLPRADRIAFMRSVLGPDAPLPESLTEGDLSPKARQVFDALSTAYQGDLGEVLKHIQVERFYISARYRRSAVTVDPQLRVDAGVRQITADRSLGSLPPSLHTLTLYEPLGDLVDANRGVLEFNDLLKRPVEAFKYLLSTCETGAVRLDTLTLHVDTVLLGTCNANRLTKFMGDPDFASFKGRLELVRMPYLIDYVQEARIYRTVLDDLADELAIGPHVAEALALWAILCRLEAPEEQAGAPEALAEALGKLNPLDKALLYAHGQTPAGLPRDVANAISGVVADLYRAGDAREAYEGRFGPSPRTLKGLLLSAARGADGCLTTVSLLKALEEMVQQIAVYPFLRMEPEGEWHNPRKAIDYVRGWYLDRVEDELHRAMGLVDHEATADLMTRYVDHAVHFVRGEKRINPVTGRAEDSDEQLMLDVERRLGIQSDTPRTTREGIVHRIAAWRMDHPDDPLDYGIIFDAQLTRLNDSFYESKRKQSDRIRRDLLTHLVDPDAHLDAQARTRVESTVTALHDAFGYDRACAVEVIGFLFRQRGDTA